MEWVDKMDLVLEKLYTESGHGPTMTKLEEWLAKKDIHKGEIEDITLYLYNKGYMYCNVSGDRTAKYSDNGMFLLNCAGKMFWEDKGGFRKQAKRETNEATLQSWQTWAIAIGTVAAGIYGIYEICRSLFC